MGIVTQGLARAARSVTARTPVIATPTARALASSRQTRHVGPVNAQMLRAWSYSPIPRAAIDFYAGKVALADWELVPYRSDGPKPDKGLMNRIRELLEQPSPGDASTGTYLTAVTEDVMTLDAGVVEKERFLNGEIAFLWITHGGENWKVDRFWDGDPRSPRYYFEPDPTTSIAFRNSEVVYHKMHSRANSPVGISYLDAAKTVIESIISAQRYNQRAVTQTVPDGIFNLGEDVRDTQVEQFETYFKQEILGQQAMAFIGGSKNPGFISFRPKNVDMQYMEWLGFEVKVFCAVMQMSPQDLGFTMEINRATGEVQQEVSESKGIIPVLSRIQDYTTSEIVWDKGFGGRANNIAFRFRAVSERQSKALAEVHKMTLAGMPSQTVNEARKDRGLRPISPQGYEGDPNDPTNPFNMLMANTPLGLVLLDKVPSAYDVAKTQPTGQEALTDGGQAGEGKPDAGA